MPADPTPHGARRRPPPRRPAARLPPRRGRAGSGSGDAPQRLAQIALRDLPWEIGVAKPDPAVVVDGVTRTFGGLTAVSVDHLEIQRGGITGLIGPNGAGKTTLFNLLTGFDQPDTGTWSFDGKSLGKLSPHQVARLGVVRTFQLTKALSRLTVLQNMLLGRPGPAGRELLPCARPGHLEGAGEGEHRAGDGPAPAVQAGRQEGRLRRHAVRRSAQAARDGAGADERPAGRHARRADGRREPGAHAEPARARQGPARAGHDGDLRRARHGRRPRHQRLGGRHGRRPDHRRGPARVDQPEPGRRRRLPRGAPRRTAHRRGGGPCPRRGRARRSPARNRPTATSSAPTTPPGKRPDR